MVEISNARPNEDVRGAAPAWRPLSVVVTDVHDQYADTLRVLLGPHGFEIHRVRSGNDAIRLAEQRAVNAAVLNSDLPDMPGVRVLRVIRSLDLRMPIILVGQPGGPDEPAAQQEHLLRTALQLQAFSVLSEPVDMEVLLGQMARLFNLFVAALGRGQPISPAVAAGGMIQPDGSSPGVEPMRAVEPGRQIRPLRLRFRLRRPR